MNKVDNTISYYDKNAEAFVSDTVTADMKEILDRFSQIMRKGGRILDLGCGTGRDSLYLISKGFDVVAVDGSEMMCKVAAENLGKRIECMRFEDLVYDNEFDGIWACASLLHVEKKKQTEVWLKIKKALKEKGIVYASYKLGNYSGIRNGRYYYDVSKKDLKGLMINVGLSILDIWESIDVRPSNNTKWINMICLKE